MVILQTDSIVFYRSDIFYSPETPTCIKNNCYHSQVNPRQEVQPKGPGVRAWRNAVSLRFFFLELTEI